MSVQPTDGDYVTLGVDARQMDRYADVALENGDVLVYDREDEEAWIQAGFAIDLDLMV